MVSFLLLLFVYSLPSIKLFLESVCFIFCSSILVAFLSPILIGDSSRSDYYLDSGDAYERSGGRRSSLYEGESGHDHRDPAGDFNRSAYGFNTSRSVSNPSVRSQPPAPLPFITLFYVFSRSFLSFGLGTKTHTCVFLLLLLLSEV